MSYILELKQRIEELKREEARLSDLIDSCYPQAHSAIINKHREIEWELSRTQEEYEYETREFAQGETEDEKLSNMFSKEWGTK